MSSGFSDSRRSGRGSSSRSCSSASGSHDLWRPGSNKSTLVLCAIVTASEFVSAPNLEIYYCDRERPASDPADKSSSSSSGSSAAARRPRFGAENSGLFICASVLDAAAAAAAPSLFRLVGMAVGVVCVTGAGGFIGSWIVKLLLARGYAVRGTSRRADDPKNAHLWALDGAAERLTMMQVDLLDRASLSAAFHGCDGVIHTASPMHDTPEEIIEPVITGTRNVVEVAADAGVRRVVLSSTIGTMYMDPRRDPDALLDDSCWSDLDYCKSTKNWYCYAKTIAERGAWEAARARGLDLAVVIPVVVLGELLQPGMNTSTRHILKYLTGEAKAYVNESHAYVHVVDAAEAHVRVLEAPGAGGRRYICAERMLHRGELCRILAELFPEYPIPTRCKDEVNPPKKGYKFTNQPLKDLGMKFTPVHEYLYEAVKSLQEKGFIQKASDNKVLDKRSSPPQKSTAPILISKL